MNTTLEGRAIRRPLPTVLPDRCGGRLVGGAPAGARGARPFCGWSYGTVCRAKVRAPEAAGKVSKVGMDVGVFAGETHRQGADANEWANESIAGRSQAKGGAHLDCAPFNCRAHRAHGSQPASD